MKNYIIRETITFENPYSKTGKTTNVSFIKEPINMSGMQLSTKQESEAFVFNPKEIGFSKYGIGTKKDIKSFETYTLIREAIETDKEETVHQDNGWTFKTQIIATKGEITKIINE